MNEGGGGKEIIIPFAQEYKDGVSIAEGQDRLKIHKGVNNPKFDIRLP